MNDYYIIFYYIMILLSLLEIFFMKRNDEKKEDIDDNKEIENNISPIKNFVILFGLGIIIYFLLHLANQNDTQFKVGGYNIFLFILLIFDILISLFFVSKQLVEYVNNIVFIQ